MKKKTPLPNFKSIDEETKFWKEHDSTNYLDWNKAKPARFPNLKPSSTTISLRLPVTLLNEIKIQANKNDIPYQSLIKIVLAQNIYAKQQHKK